MVVKPDLYVKDANGLHIPGEPVFIRFERAAKKPGGVERPHMLAMTEAEGLRLLGILQSMAQEFGWPAPAKPIITHQPPDKIVGERLEAGPARQ